MFKENIFDKCGLTGIIVFVFGALNQSRRAKMAETVRCCFSVEEIIRVSEKFEIVSITVVMDTGQQIQGELTNQRISIEGVKEVDLRKVREFRVRI